MLLTVKNYCQQHSPVSLKQMQHDLAIDKDVLEAILDQLVRKKWINQAQKTSFCQSRCFHCPAEDTLVYLYTKK